MRTIIAGLVSVGLIVAFAGTSNAQNRQKHDRQHGQYTNSPAAITDEQRRRNERAYERGEYYEHDSNALPVGSRAWFEQKEREGADR
jgi:hypothetical protein